MLKRFPGKITPGARSIKIKAEGPESCLDNFKSGNRGILKKSLRSIHSRPPVLLQKQCRGDKLVEKNKNAIG